MMNSFWQRTLVLTLGTVLLAAPCSARDLSLSDAIELALMGNTGLAVTQKGEITAEEALKQAKGQKGVTISLSDNLSTSKNASSDSSASNNLSLSGSYPLYSGGKNEAAVRRSELALDEAGLLTERERENMKLTVTQDYYDALEAARTIDVRADTVKKYQDHLDLVAELYAAGSRAKIDVLDMSVQLSNAKQDLIRAKNAYEVKLAKLRNDTNIDRSEPLTLTTDFVYEPFLRNLEQALAYSQTNRKDLIADAGRIRQKEEALKEAQAGKKPSVNLTASAGHDDLFRPSSDTGDDLRAGVGLSWDLFDSGITDSRIRSAKNDIETAKLTLKRDTEDADLTLREAYYNMMEARERFESTGSAVRLAEENYYIAREKYRAGEGLMIDITDAQEALLTARLNEITAKYDYVRYKAAVENAMGISLTDAERRAADKMAPLLESVKDGTAVARALGEKTTKKTAQKESREKAAESREDKETIETSEIESDEKPLQEMVEPKGREADPATKGVKRADPAADEVAREMAGGK